MNEAKEETLCAEFPRIAVYTNDFPKLSETFIQAQVAFLNAVVICRTSSSEVNCAEVYTLEAPDDSRTLKTKLEFWRKRLVRGRYPGYWLSDRSESRLEAHLAALKPDVLLAEFGAGLIDVADVAKGLGIPVVVHFHGHDLSRQLRFPTYVRSIKRALATASAAVVVNVKMVERVNLMCPRLPVHCIPYGFPNFNPELRSLPSDARPIVLAVGRLVDKKDPMGLLEVARELQSLGERVEVRVIGDGPLRTDFLAALPEAHAGVTVTHLGAQPHHRVLAEMSSASVYLQLSRVAEDGDEEGWPVSVAEAMATGLPVVATESPGIEDQVVEGSGVLVRPGDYRAAAEAIADYLRDPVLAQAAGSCGRGIAESYSRDRVALPALRGVLHAAAREAASSKFKK